MIKVQRETFTSDGIFGTLTLDDHTFTCKTLERKDKAIDAGIYSMEFTYSPAFNRIMPLINVPGREGIRIHWANYPQQLEGCISVGEKIDGDAVDSSRIAFNQLWNVIHDKTPLNIQVLDPGHVG